MKRWFFELVLCLALTGCEKDREVECVITETSPSSFNYQTKGSTGSIVLAAVDSTWEVRHLAGDSLTDVWVLNHAVYQFDCGDLTGDGMPEILVGVIKATRYNLSKQKILLLYQNSKYFTFSY